MSDTPERIWPVGGYAPGNYMCKCTTCGKTHMADKRAWQCADCVIQRLRSTASPDVAALIREAEARGMERAGLAVANTEIGFHDGISGDWRPMDGPSIISACCAAIRAEAAAIRGEGK